MKPTVIEKMKKEIPFELKHINRHRFCPACEKMYLSTIKTLEKQVEVLTEMLRMEHLSKPVVMQIPEGSELINLNEK